MRLESVETQSILSKEGVSCHTRNEDRVLQRYIQWKMTNLDTLRGVEYPHSEVEKHYSI